MPSDRISEDEPAFRPFADDAAVTRLGALSLENGTSRIALHGSLDITKDRRGLVQARALRAALDAIVQALEAADLPEQVAEATKPIGRVSNPFS